MTPLQFEDSVLGAVIVYVLLAAMVIGYLAFEWKASAADREARKYRRRAQ
jgi:hypothetical protein